MYRIDYEEKKRGPSSCLSPFLLGFFSFFLFFPFWSKKRKKSLNIFRQQEKSLISSTIVGGVEKVRMVWVTSTWSWWRVRAPCAALSLLSPQKWFVLKIKKKWWKKNESFFASIRNTQKPSDTQKDTHQNEAERLLCCEMKTGAKTLRVIKVKGEEASRVWWP